MQNPLYRTVVYVDGFYFYYGAVRRTRYKWLDPVALFRKVLGAQNSVVTVKYFTARVQPTPNDPDVNVRQDTPTCALCRRTAHWWSCITVIFCVTRFEWST